MHKKIQKTTSARSSGVKSDPRDGKIEILEKRLSPKAQNYYTDLEGTCCDFVTTGWCHCKIHQKCYRKKTKAWDHI
jgi:hypothetical protein